MKILKYDMVIWFEFLWKWAAIFFAVHFLKQYAKLVIIGSKMFYFQVLHYILNFLTTDISELNKEINIFCFDTTMWKRIQNIKEILIFKASLINSII